MDITKELKAYWDNVDFQNPKILVDRDNNVYEFGYSAVGDRQSIYWTIHYPSIQYFYNEEFGFAYSNNLKPLGNLNLYYGWVEDAEVHEKNTVFLAPDMYHILMNLFTYPPKLQEIENILYHYKK